jgi:hypothetical protein
MLLPLLLVALGLQTPPQTPPPQAPASQEPRFEVTPLDPVITPGESLQLQARILDANGDPVPGLQVRFQPSGGFFEGEVSPDGVVTGGAVGTIPVVVVASRGMGPPAVQMVRVRVVPGPAARIAVDSPPSRLAQGQSVRLTASVYSAQEDLRRDAVAWSSSDPSVVRVSGMGVVTAVAPGRATVTARAGDASLALPVEVPAARVARVEIEPAEVRALQGDVLTFEVRALDEQGREIPGLEPHWSFSPGGGLLDAQGRFVGYDAGDYTVTASFGTSTATAAVTLAHRDVRRPVEVVGRLPRTGFTTEEVWLHPSGEYAYLGTGSGGDRFYAIDIRDPANPVVTDSVVANTRRVNDLMTTPDGRYMVFTREGAADRMNGLVIAQLYDPAHPVPIAEFTDGVTGGVHSSFIYQQEEHGTHVYLTNNGTGALHILDISDPYNPVEASQWRTPRPDAGRTLHDVDVQDGLAYLSYWNDGLVILDIGNGVQGGAPPIPSW